jgi:hypothetical protein
MLFSSGALFPKFIASVHACAFAPRFRASEEFGAGAGG